MPSTSTNQPCPKCKTNLLWVVDYPERGTGCIVILIGLIFSPILLGIPVLIYGFILRGKAKHSFQCPGCGTVLPVAQK